MRASIGVSLPLHELEPGKKLLSLDGFVKTMTMIDTIAKKEVDEGFENPAFVSKSFKVLGPGMMQVKFLYNVSRQRVRERRIRSSYNEFTNNNGGWTDSNNNMSFNGSSGSLTIGNSGTSYISMDTATGSDSSGFTVYQTGAYEYESF